VYVFRAKRLDRVKLLWWRHGHLPADEAANPGRFKGAKFRWLDIEDGVLRLTPGQRAGAFGNACPVLRQPTSLARPGGNCVGMATAASSTRWRKKRELYGVHGAVNRPSNEHSSWSNGMAVIAEHVRPILRLARRMVPDRRLMLVSAMRAAIGIGIIFALEPLAVGAATKGLVDFMGKTMCFLALYGLVGHAERAFMDAVVRRVERTTGIDFKDESDRRGSHDRIAA
jgi:hypothetical protein